MSLFVCFYCLIGWVGASRGLSRKVMFLVTNYRIFLTRRPSCHAENHGWSRMSVMNFLFYHELSNYRIVSSHGLSRRSRIIELSNFLHTECRGRSRVFLFITDCRIFFFTRSVAEGHGGSSFLGLSNCFFTRNDAEGHELSNYRIFFTRIVAEVTNYRIIELFLYT